MKLNEMQFYIKYDDETPLEALQSHIYEQNEFTGFDTQEEAEKEAKFMLNENVSYVILIGSELKKLL